MWYCEEDKPDKTGWYICCSKSRFIPCGGCCCCCCWRLFSCSITELDSERFIVLDSCEYFNRRSWPTWNFSCELYGGRSLTAHCWCSRWWVTGRWDGGRLCRSGRQKSGRGAGKARAPPPAAAAHHAAAHRSSTRPATSTSSRATRPPRHLDATAATLPPPVFPRSEYFSFFFQPSMQIWLKNATSNQSFLAGYYLATLSFC